MGENAFMKFNKTKCTKDKFFNTLLGFHCFTGCGFTSRFAGCGKIEPLSLMGTYQEYVEALSDLGVSSDVSGSTVCDLHIVSCMERKMSIHKISLSMT